MSVKHISNEQNLSSFTINAKTFVKIWNLHIPDLRDIVVITCEFKQVPTQFLFKSNMILKF